MAQPAMARDRTLRLIEKRCATIRRLVQRLDNKCWQLERTVDRLGMDDPWEREMDKAEIAVDCLNSWLNLAEKNLCIASTSSDCSNRYEDDH